MLIIPNRLRAVVSVIAPEAAVSRVKLEAAVSAVRLSATVRVVGDSIIAVLTDPVAVADAIAKGFGKALADAISLADNVTVTAYRGSELNGAILNGVELNG